MSNPSFTCPRCGMTSYNPNDIREGYCGACHDWTSPPGTLPEPVFVVLRAARGVPFLWMPADQEGVWYYREDLLTRLGRIVESAPHAIAVPTGRLEHREDGATAQVWEVHPINGNYANDGDEGDWKS